MAQQDTDLTDYCLLHTTTIERAHEKAEGAEVLTLKFKYFESVEDMGSNRPKEIKLWTYRDEAVALAQLILRMAEKT